MSTKEERMKDRVDEILDAIGRVKIVRQFDIKEQYVAIAQRLKLDLEIMLGTDSNIEATDSGWRNINTLKTDYRNGLFLEMVDVPDIDRDNLKKCLNEILGDKKINLLSGMSYRIKGTLPDSNRFFHNDFSKWGIKQPTGLKGNKEMALNHIAEIIVAISFCESHRSKNDYRWDKSITERVFDSIFHQVKTFVHTGELKLKKPGNIDIKKASEFPKPMVFLSDDRNNLVWKYSKFCSICGSRSQSCWCEDVDMKITKSDMLDCVCYGCYKECINRAWTGNYDEVFTVGNCSDKLSEFIQYYIEVITPSLYEVKEKEDAMAIVNEWTKKHGEYFDIELVQEEYEGEDMFSTDICHKTISEKQFEKIYKEIYEWTDFDEGDPPDNMCSCPTW